jgi:hypothetical protein
MTTQVATTTPDANPDYNPDDSSDDNLMKTSIDNPDEYTKL